MDSKTWEICYNLRWLPAFNFRWRYYSLKEAIRYSEGRSNLQVYDKHGIRYHEFGFWGVEQDPGWRKQHTGGAGDHGHGENLGTVCRGLSAVSSTDWGPTVQCTQFYSFTPVPHSVSVSVVLDTGCVPKLNCETYTKFREGKSASKSIRATKIKSQQLRHTRNTFMLILKKKKKSTCCPFVTSFLQNLV